jgi:hypothetical protein
MQTIAGLTGLLGIILLLSFGAYRVLDHFRKLVVTAAGGQGSQAVFACPKVCVSRCACCQQWPYGLQDTAGTGTAALS